MEVLLIPTPNIMFWTFVTFGLLVIALGKWGWKPIIHALDARITKIRSDLDHAEKNRAQSDKLIEEQKKRFWLRQELVRKAFWQKQSKKRLLQEKNF